MYRPIKPRKTEKQKQIEEEEAERAREQERQEAERERKEAGNLKRRSDEIEIKIENFKLNKINIHR